MTAPIPGIGPPTEFARRGWYADPWQRDQLRYWDGCQWTPDTRTPAEVTIHKRTAGDPGYNLLITILTCGLWAPVWMTRSADRWRVKRKRVGGRWNGRRC